MEFNKEFIIDLKSNKRKSNKEICKILNVSENKLSKYLKENNISFKEKNYELMKSMFLKGETIKGMSKICGCTEGAIRYNLIKFGLIEDTRIVKKCCVCGKESKNVESLKGKLYCKKHYNHIYRYGKIIEYTIYDNNEYDVKSGIVYMKLKNSKGELRGIVEFDEEFLCKVTKYKWYLKNSKPRYAVTKGINKNSPISMQDVIMDNLNIKHHPIKKYDHIDNNGLNNKVSNLRIVTHQENAMNMSMKNTNTSGVVGVCRYKQDVDLKWDASITYNYKSIWFGRSTIFDEAVKMRIIGEANYFKEYSNNYNPSTNTIQLNYISQDDDKQTFIESDLKGNILKFEKY